MKAILWDSKAKAVRSGKVPEPVISAPDEIKARVLTAGICGTDREAFAGAGFQPPHGRDDIIIGHEVLARVVEVGRFVSSFNPGDLVTFTIRRGCGKCRPCDIGRSDLCATGGYKERGLDYMDGFQAEFVVDSEANVVKVPEGLKDAGVLCEPFSTIQKALQEAVKATARMPDALIDGDWFKGRKCLVMGLGPIGLLASLALTLRGAVVYGVDEVDEGSPRPEWLKTIGGGYIDGRKIKPNEAANISGGKFGLIFQAAGALETTFAFIDALAPNGAFIFFAAGKGKAEIDAKLVRNLIDGNNTLIGSISSTRVHFELAISDLESASLKWGGHVEKLINKKYRPSEFEKGINEHTVDEIKAVVDWE